MFAAGSRDSSCVVVKSSWFHEIKCCQADWSDILVSCIIGGIASVVELTVLVNVFINADLVIPLSFIKPEVHDNGVVFWVKSSSHDIQGLRRFFVSAAATEPDNVTTINRVDSVTTITSEDGVPAGTCPDCVLTCVTPDGVLASFTPEHIILASSMDFIILETTVDFVFS